MLGEGASGKVTVGTYRGREVAVKTCKTLFEAEREARTLETLSSPKRHVNVVRYYGRDGEKLYLERLGKSFFELKVRDWATAFRLMKDAARGLRYLHRRGLVHGDVTPANVLADDRVGRAALIDFITTDERGRQRTGLTPGWADPDARIGQPLRQEHDVYSLGRTFVHLIDNIPLPDNSALNELLVNMLSTQRPTVEECVTTLSTLIKAGAPCPKCGYWTPRDIPWCPSRN